MAEREARQAEKEGENNEQTDWKDGSPKGEDEHRLKHRGRMVVTRAKKRAEAGSGVSGWGEGIKGKSGRRQEGTTERSQK